MKAIRPKQFRLHTASAGSPLEGLRREQADSVMPLIGGLLDAWDGLPNDLRGDIRDDHPAFHRSIEAIRAAMERRYNNYYTDPPPPV